MYDKYADDEGNGKHKIKVIPVPYEGAVSFGRGTSEGPRAILRASLEIETWDEEMQTDLLSLVSFSTMEYFDPPVDGPSRVIESLLELLKENFSPQEDFIMTLGGDHSISLAPIMFYHSFYKDMMVLHIDAHADLRDIFQGSQYSHGCTIARLRDRQIPVIQIGIRSLCREESLKIRQDKEITTFFAHDVITKATEEIAKKVATIVGQRPLYLTFDVDGLDPSVIPGTGTPEPGGLPFSWFQKLWIELFSHPVHLIGMDVVELAPIAGNVLSESTTVRCINRILSAYFKDK